ncbi:GntR family transcriptional regulator [Clostridium oryzae]|uniref:Arabinose metabolism transcriptional repressor n=1 Tax=Clostridium oryzae TaxID=1450648 RepID=A0A1V4IRV5_9CLOT|nr:substrate-binding domain-containing protein [Clostridium oryzae]OPJ62752.1 arabinose metabolism transcriptional repressor [Clostridium oryzae]
MESVPLYKKIEDDLKNKITTGELAPGDQIPTELELSVLYNVSRITSKRALSDLENEHLIYRIQGKGSFVSKSGKLASGEQKSNDILFILPFPDNLGFGDYTKGIINCLKHTDYKLSIQPSAFINHDNLQSIICQYAGLILYPETSSSNLDTLFSIHLDEFPTVIIDKKLSGIDFNNVSADNFSGGYTAAEYLIKNNHTKIAFIATHEITHSTSVRDRYLGYLKAVHNYGLDFYSKNIYPDVFDKTTLEDYITDFLKYVSKNHITSVIAENDLCAIHLMKLAKNMGFDLPKDLSIVGFDNIQASAFVEPALTTISQDFEKMGFLAAELLLKDIESTSRSEKPSVISVDINLIERESVYKIN